jgi:hypothetical protein
MQWVTFAGIATRFRLVFNLEQYLVDLFSMLYMIVYPIVNFPSSYAVDNWNMKAAVNIYNFIFSDVIFCIVYYNRSILENICQ